MKDIESRIQYKDKTYRIVFNINVMEAIQAEYGSLEAWGAKMDGTNEPDAKAMRFGFAQMLNEGIEMDNEENGTDTPLLTLKQAGRIISEVGITETTAVLNRTINESTENDEKNA